jgi:hypothetical protein
VRPEGPIETRDRELPRRGIRRIRRGDAHERDAAVARVWHRRWGARGREEETREHRKTSHGLEHDENLLRADDKPLQQPPYQAAREGVAALPSWRSAPRSGARQPSIIARGYTLFIDAA